MNKHERRQKRAQYAVNLFSLLAFMNAYLFAAAYLMIDLMLWPAAIVSATFGASFLQGPFIYAKSPARMAVLSTASSCVHYPLLTYLLGADSGIQLFMLTGPSVMNLGLGTTRLRLSIALTAILVGTLLGCFVFLEEAALLPAREAFAQTILLIGVLATTASIILTIGHISLSRAETAEDALEAEHARSEALLYNLLPTEIAARLKDAPDQTIADSLDHTAILFADIVDFTPRSARMAPEELVSFLNRIFSTFDELAAKHGLEKIKTIGDAYMVAAGLPQPVDRPVHRVAEMAFDMLDALRALSDEIGEAIEIRIGLHAGPVVAGVIGHQKLFYDVWGDTVNTASRMESHGQPGRIQVTAAAREALKDAYDFEPRGAVEIKGIGRLETWWLTARGAPIADA
ncbi:adenylate/guanylate cyclase domain-containing protein [Ruegeria alba]|uniref:adenylate/guanylate cyclase domain-containing protein n=1 Tax=Ruegeria alba TaxID=2916756 RepID=UPI0034E24B15